jgi:hypothetical protein
VGTDQPYWSTVSSPDLLSVDTVSGGIRTFNLPHQVEVVYDLYDEQILARNVTAFNVELSPASTTLYYTGKEKLIDTLK